MARPVQPDAGRPDGAVQVRPELLGPPAGVRPARRGADALGPGGPRGFYVEDRPAEELYDLDADPHERENLASDRALYEPASAGSDPDPEDADVLDEMRERLDEWMEATDDPLLDGPVPYLDPDAE